VSVSIPSPGAEQLRAGCCSGGGSACRDGGPRDVLDMGAPVRRDGLPGGTAGWSTFFAVSRAPILTVILALVHAADRARLAALRSTPAALRTCRRSI
jgi:hypothetical protein